MYSGKKENLFQSYVPSRTTFMELPGTGPYNIWSIGNTVLAGENPESESYTPQDQLEYKELQSLVNRALGKLPERRLRIFRMHRFEGMKYAEIASSLSLSIKTVEAEMTKALQTLRKEIENYT